MPLSLEQEVRRRCPQALGCGRLSPEETRWVWWSAQPADGETALKLLGETFRVLRMYRLGMKTLRLEMAAGTLWAHQCGAVTYAVLLPTGASSKALEQIAWSDAS